MHSNLEAEIARRGISKTELSNKANIPYSTLLNKISSGDFSTDEAFAIADILNIDESKLRELFKKSA